MIDQLAPCVCVIVNLTVLYCTYLQRLVKRNVRKTQLLLCRKHLPEGVSTVGFFFIRTSCDAIPVPSSPGEANSLLPRCFETGTVNNKPLNALDRVLTHVYMPMLMAAGERLLYSYGYMCVCSYS